MSLPHCDSYDGHIVLSYVASLLSEDGRELNGIKLTESNRQKLERWAGKDTVPLLGVDILLVRYELMTYELEVWAEEHYGWNGFIPKGGASQIVR